MTKARELAKKNLEESQATMKVWYDKRAKKCSFKFEVQGIHFKQDTVDHL